MNSNGNRFVLLTGAAGLQAGGTGCAWDARQGALALQRLDTPRLPRLGAADALALWQAATPLLQDDHGQLGR